MFLSTASIGVKVTVWLIGVLGLTTILTLRMSKLLNVDKKMWGRDRHVNRTHKMVELILNIGFAITTFTMTMNNVEFIFFLNISIGYAIMHFGIRAIFEKKYAENPKDYLYTLSEFLFLMSSFYVMTYLIFPEYIKFT